MHVAIAMLTSARRSEPVDPSSRDLSFAGDAPGPAMISPGSLPRETTGPNRAESWRVA